MAPQRLSYSTGAPARQLLSAVSAQSPPGSPIASMSSSSSTDVVIVAAARTPIGEYTFARAFQSRCYILILLLSERGLVFNLRICTPICRMNEREKMDCCRACRFGDNGICITTRVSFLSILRFIACVVVLRN